MMPAKKASVKNAAEVQCVIDGLGGKENILSVDNCFTRLRVNIKDPAKLDEAAINKLPNSGIVKKGTDIQIVYGLQVADIQACCGGTAGKPVKPLFRARRIAPG